MKIFDPNLICPLCAIRPALNNGKRYTKREHIPPKSIFSNLNNNMVTVPACADCNEGTSSLDEEFKTQIGIYIGRSAVDFWQSALKTIRHPHKKKLKGKILDNLSPILSPMGNGKWGHQVKVDAKPIMVVAQKIVRGLYWHKLGLNIPPNIDMDVSMVRQGEKLVPEIQDNLNRYGEIIKIGNGEFEAHYAIAEGEQHGSIWLLRFYGEDCILVIATQDKI